MTSTVKEAPTIRVITLRLYQITIMSDKLQILILEGLIPAIERAGLGVRRQRDMISAVRTVIRLADFDLATTTDDLASIREALDSMAQRHPELSRGRLNNLRSLFGKALSLVTPVMPSRNEAELSAAWKRLVDQTSFGNRTRLLPALRFFSERGIGPEQVGGEELELFRDTYLDLSLRRRREQAWDALAVSWNYAVKHIPGWPRMFLPQEFTRDIYIKKWSYFPPSLSDEVSRLTHSWPKGNLSPASRKIYEHRLRAAASILIAEHFTPTRLRSIRNLVEFDAFSRILSFLIRRQGGVATASVQQMARFLIMIAHHWVQLPANNLEAHRHLAEKLRTKDFSLLNQSKT